MPEVHIIMEVLHAACGSGRSIQDTVRSVLEKFASIQMIDVYLPTTEGNELLLRRYTQPDKDQLLLLSRLNLTLPEQPKPQLLRKTPEMKELRMQL